MRTLSLTELSMISGGEVAYVITQKISTDGFTPACVLAFSTLDISLSDEAKFIHLLGSCKIAELELLHDRADSAPLLSSSRV